VALDKPKELFAPGYEKRGFLPLEDPLTAFPYGSLYAILDEIGRDLPSLLYDKGFRAYAQGLYLPAWGGPITEETLPQLRLYYLRVGFLASAYVNMVGQEPAKVLPQNIAAPLVCVARLLSRPPILSYDGYALVQLEALS
jgi:indoleamine 2,3-dioxygenase